MTTSARRVAVIGGGITGLAAAQALADQGRRRSCCSRATTAWAASCAPRRSPGTTAIDEGPDAFLARLPWGTALARQVGLGDTLVSPAAGKAAVWWQQLHDIPQGLLLGMPTDVLALAKSKLISWPGKLRAATEPFRPRTSLDADSLGAFVRSRFGDEVHLRLVDPLVGSIYAADTDHFSLAAVPQIADLAGKARSILVAGRKMPKPSPDCRPGVLRTGGRHGRVRVGHRRRSDRARRRAAQRRVGHRTRRRRQRLAGRRRVVRRACCSPAPPAQLPACSRPSHPTSPPRCAPSRWPTSRW